MLLLLGVIVRTCLSNWIGAIIIFVVVCNYNS